MVRRERGGGDERETTPPQRAFRAGLPRFPPTPHPTPPLHPQDGTLIQAHNAAAGPWGGNNWGATRPEDFDLYNDDVPSVLQSLIASGHHIVILSNQGNIRSAVTGKRGSLMMQRFDLALAQLGVPATVLVATASSKDPDFHGCRKPGTGLWTLFKAGYNGGVEPDLASSFFCGDAAGRAASAAREGDFSDSDRVFAEAVVLPFFVPEDKLGQGAASPVKAEAGGRGGGYLKDDSLPTKDGIVVFLRALGAKFKDMHTFKRCGWDGWGGWKVRLIFLFVSRSRTLSTHPSPPHTTASPTTKPPKPLTTSPRPSPPTAPPASPASRR